MLTKRKEKVQRLSLIALSDKNWLKFIQARALINEIEKRESENRNQFTNYLKSLR